MAARYDAGRALPLSSIDGWRVVLAPYLSTSELPVLDLGSGTGLWSEALAEWFDASIVGVEPSEAMRREAAAKSLPPDVSIVGGVAEHVPLRDHSCECAWLSTVLHHIQDLRACARELHRVVREKGSLLIRNSFGDRLEHITWLRYFPAARLVASRRWPTVDATAEAFATEGFEVKALRSVPELVAPDLAAYYERIRVRANSTLTLISDQEFQEGLAELRRVADVKPSGTVVDHKDLLVLRRSDAHDTRRRGQHPFY
jgi:ubiquinone/menaquinone biosynthesis C-methylase UbiE